MKSAQWRESSREVLGLAPKAGRAVRESGRFQRRQLMPRQVPLSSRQATPFKISGEPPRLMVWV